MQKIISFKDSLATVFKITNFKRVCRRCEYLSRVYLTSGSLAAGHGH